MLECPDNLLYSESHAWVDTAEAESKGTVQVGFTHYLIEELPEILSLDLPMPGDAVELDSPCIHLHLDSGVIESLRSPVAGHVHEVNRDVLDKPDLLHVDPYANWILEIEFEDSTDFEILAESARYTRFADSQ